MRLWERLAKLLVLFGAFALAAYFAITFRAGGLWRGLEPALAVTSSPSTKGPYDLTRLEAVNETLKTIRDKYVDPSRVHPREMFLSALNYVQRDVAQVMVLYEEGAPELSVRVEAGEKKFRVDNIQGPWDVSARLREVFAYLQEKLRSSDVDLREVEYAACNGMLHTLDPHSVFLSPDAYKEMNLSTSGAFGGLGIVISIRDQMLTVMNPMPDTPAGRAGLQRFDRITKINNESTLNMPLDDAVKRLRGDPGTKVTVWVHRDGRDNTPGWQGSKPFELVREQIKVKSVESRLLEGEVGYLRLKQFQSGSSAEVDNALAEFRKKAPNLHGVVLDLRGNPGGLLDQAAKIADKWIRDGVLVATVGMAEGREEKLARSEGNEPDYPLVVLVNGSSASASEIVAGALKNHDRAVIVGEQTFGKGSVQLVFPDVTPDKAALKLTIAQYLTPGDVSIQGVGVIPDIELDPMTVDSLEMDIYAQRKGLRERDLSQHLSNSRAHDGGKPLDLVRYNFPESERQAMRERGGELDDNTFTPDFPIKFGRDLVLHMPSGKRVDQVHAAKDFIAQVGKEEWGKVSAELGKLAVEWADAANADVGPAAQDFEVKVESDRTDADVTAGESMTLKVSVKNNGKQPAYRVRATTKSDNAFLDSKELIFGKIGPGQTKTANTPLGWCDVDGRKPGSSAPVASNAPRVCKIPKDSVTRSDGVKVKFDAAGGHAPADAEIRTTIRGLERPVFEYAYQIEDNRSGNGDGRVQRGEALTMYLTVKNVGRGRSYETQANLRNLSGDGLLLRDGRFDVSNMLPGDVRKVAFTFDVQQVTDEVKAELSVGDRDLKEIANEKIKIPVEPPAAVMPASGAVHATASGAVLLDAGEPNARAFGKVAKDTALARLGRIGDYFKVDLGGGRFAFVSAKETAEGGTPASPVAFEPVYSHAPPMIDVAPAALATRDGHIKVSATASDVTKLLDSYIFVGSRKVFYQSNQTGRDPKKATLAADVGLRPGVNVITVFARESPDTVSRRTIVVRRDGPGGELLPTPTTEDSLWQSSDGDDELPP